MASTPEGRRSPSRFGSLLSPKVLTRAQEKEELSNLNDRLASYIDRMRFLEDSNARLTAEVTTSKENVSREIQNVKALYDSELADARRLVDETTKDRAKLQLENNKLNGLLSDLRDRLDKETAARNAAEDQLKLVERRLQDKESHITVISKERKELEKRIQNLEVQIKQLQEDLDHAKGECENEMLRRVDAENKLLSLQETLEFNEQVHLKELAEARATAEQTKFTIQTDLPQQYDTLIRSKLEELRDEFEEEAELAKKELEEAYKGKFEDLKSSAGKDRSNVSRLISKNSELRTELDTLKSDYGVLEAKNGSLQKRITELENLRALDREDVRKQMQDKDDRIKQLEDDLEALSNDYEQLMGIKIALDVEIRAYRKLLEGEEERLNMTPSSAARVAQVTRGTKRSRTEFEGAQTSSSVVSNSASGVIQIAEVDPEGKFVKLHNSSTEDAALGGWVIARVADAGEVVEYKFTPKFVLKGDQAVAIWGHSTGMKPKAPSDLVLKSSDWGIGKNVVTSVLNPDGEVVAKMTESATAVDDVDAAPSRRTRRARRTGGVAEREGCVIS